MQKIKEILNKLNLVRIFWIVLILSLLSAVCYVYYRTQIYSPRVKSECNKTSLRQAVDSYESEDYSAFVKTLSKSLTNNEEEYYKKAVASNLYDKNQYELFYKQCLRSKGF